MGRTALLLIGALLAVPALALQPDQALSPVQIGMLKILGGQMLVIALLCFVVSELTKNYSQVDKLWSITPAIYAWTATLQGGMDPRMIVMAGLITVWGIRLTYNFGRMGGYSWKFWEGHQDYRWDHVRKNPPLDRDWAWRLFNLLFISLYQHALLLLITLPIVVVHGAGQALGWVDLVLASLLLALVVFETIADQQQWRFQTEKHRRLALGGDLPEAYARGFIASGLWARSRHPNYFAEQSIWVAFFAFSLAAGVGLNWSVAGCVLLILLFQGSSRLSESISAGKYPAYQDYQRKVGRFLPRLF